MSGSSRPGTTWATSMWSGSQDASEQGSGRGPGEGMAVFDEARALNPQHIAPYLSAAEGRLQARAAAPGSRSRRPAESGEGPVAVRAGADHQLQAPSATQRCREQCGSSRAREAWNAGRGSACAQLKQALKSSYEQAHGAEAPSRADAYHNAQRAACSSGRVYERAQGESPVQSLQ